MKKLILSVALINLLAACGSNPPKETVPETKAPEAKTPVAAAPAATPAPAEDKAAAQADANAKAAAAAAAATAAAAAQADAKATAEAKAKAAAESEAAARAAAEAQAKADLISAAAPNQALENRSVFFPFDVDAVQSADMETILAHGKNLSDNAALKVRVEGNADERGSSEYNLALGQRRANNTKKALVLGGARSSQVEAVSYGEEKPRASGHDEAAWAQNRRTDIEYGGGK